MMMMNVSWQAANQMFVNAFIFVEDSVFQMLLNFREFEFIGAASLPSAIALFLSLSCFHLFFFLLVSFMVVLSGPVLAGTPGTSQRSLLFSHRPFRL